MLTAAVDVQDDRFEVEIVGWGRGCESWGIRFEKLYGDLEKEETWDKLAAYLDQELYFASGSSLLIALTCIDTGGHYTTQCYKFLSRMEKRGKRIYGIKGFGKESQGIPLIHKLSTNNEYGVKVYILGVDSGKEIIVTRLNTVDEGPGYCHFPINKELGYDETYIKGLNSEQRVTEMKDGRAVVKWKKKAGTRNEPLDLRVYNTAAVEILRPNFDVLESKVKAGINYMKKRLERYKKRLEMYYEAEEAVLLNQEYTIGTKSLKRADLSTIRAAIKDLEGQIETLEANGGKNKAGRFIPRDI